MNKTCILLLEHVAVLLTAKLGPFVAIKRLARNWQVLPEENTETVCFTFM
jgi:hypothetical protein